MNLARVDAVDQNPPSRGVEKARDEAHQYALARPRRAENGDALARLHFEVDVADHGFGAVIGKSHVFETHPARTTRESNRRRGVFHFDRRIQDFKNSPRSDQRLLHRIYDVGDVVHLAGKLFEQTGENDEPRAQRQLVMRDQPTAITEQHHHVNTGEKTHRRSE